MSDDDSLFGKEKVVAGMGPVRIGVDDGGDRFVGHLANRCFEGPAPPAIPHRIYEDDAVVGDDGQGIHARGKKQVDAIADFVGLDRVPLAAHV